MGLTDRMVAKALANLPDHRAALTAQLGQGEQVRAFAFSNHMAQKGNDGVVEDLPPVCYAQFGLDRIKSITGIEPAKSIRHPMRVAFRDDSFIDFTVYDAGPLTTPDKFGDFFAAARSVSLQQ